MLNEKILNDRNIPFLILANKQDVSNAMSVTEIDDKLNLRSYKLPWYIQGCSAIDGNGLYEGLEWLYQIIKKNGKKIKG